MKIIKVGTRGSKLAVTQTKLVVEELQKQVTDIKIQIVEIETKGDKLVSHSLTKIGGQGAFVKELENQLLAGNIDFAVHSLKDLPTILPEQLTIGSVLKRVNPCDCLITNSASQTLADLPIGAKIGTSSLRRQAELLRIRPDLKILPLRGNVDTRLKRLREGNYDGIILASAGLERLGLKTPSLHFQELPLNDFLPAIGQGALAIECRKADQQILNLIQPLTDPSTLAAILAERAFLRGMDGSCTFPIGGFAEAKNDLIQVTGMIASINGQKVLKETVIHPAAETAGQLLAEKLIEQGAFSLIKECQNYVKNTSLHTSTNVPH